MLCKVNSKITKTALIVGVEKSIKMVKIEMDYNDMNVENAMFNFSLVIDLVFKPNN